MQSSEDTTQQRGKFQDKNFSAQGIDSDKIKEYKDFVKDSGLDTEQFESSGIKGAKRQGENLKGDFGNTQMGSDVIDFNEGRGHSHYARTGHSSK